MERVKTPAAFASKQSNVVVSGKCIDPFLSILVAMVFILEVKPRRPVSQFQASLTKLSALLQVVVQLRYNVELAIISSY